MGPIPPPVSHKSVGKEPNPLKGVYCICVYIVYTLYHMTHPHLSHIHTIYCNNMYNRAVEYEFIQNSKYTNTHTRTRNHSFTKDEIFSSICVSCCNRRGMTHWLKTESSLGSTSSTSYIADDRAYKQFDLFDGRKTRTKNIEGSAVLQYTSHLYYNVGI